jgi:hypothetical protein
MEKGRPTLEGVLAPLLETELLPGLDVVVSLTTGLREGTLEGVATAGVDCFPGIDCGEARVD